MPRSSGKRGTATGCKPSCGVRQKVRPGARGMWKPAAWPASKALKRQTRVEPRDIASHAPGHGRLFVCHRKLTIEGEHTMYLYNSATHRKEEFKTHTPGHVEMYTCGPTVYHFAHIGNLRSYIMEDVLEKYLRYAGYERQPGHEHHRRGPPDLRRRPGRGQDAQGRPAGAQNRHGDRPVLHRRLFRGLPQAEHQAPRRGPARHRPD